MTVKDQAQSADRSAWFLRLLTILFGLGLLGIVALADLGHPWIAMVNQAPMADKFFHFLLIGTLAGLLNLNLLRHNHANGLSPSAGRRRLLRAALVLALLVTGEEITQLFLPARRFSWADLVANYAGILIAGRWSLRRWRRNPARA